MEQINIKQLRGMTADEIKGAIPFWITADEERIALVIHPRKEEYLPLKTGQPEQPPQYITVTEALKIWRTEGSPIIHLGQGEDCFDLEKLLTKRITQRHFEAVLNWLKEQIKLIDIQIY